MSTRMLYIMLATFHMVSNSTLAGAKTESDDLRATGAVRHVNCDRGGSLSRAVRTARPGSTIFVRGVCQEAVRVDTDGLTVDGQDEAIIDAGGSSDALTIVSARQVAVKNLTIRNGVNGLVGAGGANFNLENVAVSDSEKAGVVVTGASSTELTDCTTTGSGTDGLLIERASEVQITGSFKSQSNTAFGINIINNSSATIENADVTLSQNIIGLQVGINSSLLVNGVDSTVDASNNFVVGVTIVSNSEIFVLRAKVITRENGLRGASLFSDSLLELDNGASFDASNNGSDGVFLEDAAINIFNMQVQGEPGASLITNGNSRFGISADKESSVDISGGSSLTSQGNGIGLLVDNGSRVTLINADITGNGPPGDLDLRFGSRAEIETSTIGSAACDATVLFRGDTGITCPSP